MKKIPATMAAALAAALSASSFATPAGLSASPASDGRLPDSTGMIRTYSDAGPIDTRSAFFQSLGTNGRTCATCHVIGEGMGLSAAGARARFEQTRGTDPLFAPVDGANCPTAHSHSRADHSLLLHSGLFRMRS